MTFRILVGAFFKELHDGVVVFVFLWAEVVELGHKDFLLLTDVVDFFGLFRQIGRDFLDTCRNHVRALFALS